MALINTWLDWRSAAVSWLMGLTWAWLVLAGTSVGADAGTGACLSVGHLARWVEGEVGLAR